MFNPPHLIVAVLAKLCPGYEFAMFKEQGETESNQDNGWERCKAEDFDPYVLKECGDGLRIGTSGELLFGAMGIFKRKKDEFTEDVGAFEAKSNGKEDSISVVRVAKKKKRSKLSK